MTISEKIAIEAAEWYFRLQEPSTTLAEQRACQAWRNADPAHELAWQRAVEVSEKFVGMPSGLAYATLKTSAQINRRHAIKTLAVLVTAGSLGWQGWQSEPARLYRAEYTTHTGEQRKVVLSDGTEIYLNTSSGINTRFDDKQRQIVLEAGEIMIQTSKSDALSRPFSVVTAFGQLKPLGTRFVVKQNDEDILLSVIEGSVEIATKQGDRHVVHAQKQTRFSEHKIEVANAIDTHIESWTRGILFAREMRLVDFVSELNRYRSGTLRCAPEVADLKISGAFQLNNVSAVIDSLPSMLPVKVRYLTRYWVMLDAADV
ncbi:MAG: FecR domain-containing protein [Methylophilus sp.]|nr:FecR domain-containing protein [Methylophilus sp.]